MFEILQYAFFQNALIAAVLVSIACGIMGVYVVIKRIVFISGGISHSSFGGLGIAYYLGVEPLLGALVFSVATGLGLGVLDEKSSERNDTLIGAFWAIGMAIGIIFISITPGYTSDLFSYLFGNILLVSQSHIIFMLLLDIIIIAVVAIFYRAFQAVSFDEEFAKAIGLPVFALNLLLITLVAFTIVIMIKAVGIILLIALITLPGASSGNITKNMKKMMAISVALGALYCISGIFISYLLNMPSGAIIILIASLGYIISIAFRKIRK